LRFRTVLKHSFHLLLGLLCYFIGEFKNIYLSNMATWGGL